MENCINVIAGRPGAGKTLWACREAARAAEDINNTVIYIGHQEEFDRVLRLSSHHENIFFVLPSDTFNLFKNFNRSITKRNYYLQTNNLLYNLPFHFFMDYQFNCIW